MKKISGGNMIQLQEHDYKQLIQLVSDKHGNEKTPEKGPTNIEQINLQEQNFIQTLTEQNLFFLDEADEAIMDKHAHLIFYSIAKADFVLTLHKNCDSPLQKESVNFYAYNSTLIYTHLYNSTYQICWLPHIPMVIGGITSFLKKSGGQNSLINVEGKTKEETDSDFTLTIQENLSADIETIHSITRWFVYHYSNCIKERSANE